MAKVLQLKRGAASVVGAVNKAQGEPVLVTDIPGQLRVGVDNTAAEIVIADTVGSVPNIAALIALVDTKQGDVYETLDDGKVYKRVSVGDGTASLAGDWMRIGSSNDAGGVFVWNAVAVDADAGLDEIWTDVNTTDWAAVPANVGNIDPENPQNIVIHPNSAVSFANGTGKTWRWFGISSVSLGQGVVPPTTPDPASGVIPALYTSVAGDYQLVGAQNFDDVYDAADDAGMILLPAKKGDVCNKADDGLSYKLKTQNATILVDWVKIGGATVAKPTLYDFFTTTAMLADPTIKNPGDIMRINVNAGNGGIDSRAHTLWFGGGNQTDIGTYFEIATQDFGAI